MAVGKLPPGFQGPLASQRSERLAEGVDQHFDREVARALAKGDVLEASRAGTRGNLARGFTFALRAHDLAVESSRIQRAKKIIDQP